MEFHQGPAGYGRGLFLRTSPFGGGATGGKNIMQGIWLPLITPAPA
jgi:hypothetical protein